MRKNSAPARPQMAAEVRKMTVDRENAGQRIDNFLRGQLPGVPTGRLYRLLRKGEVRVNGGRIRAEYRLADGDVVRIPPVRIDGPAAPAPAQKVAELLDRVIYEDKRLLVVDKPSGMAVHGGSGISHGVVETLRGARSDLVDLALVHRLDRETSGCLVLAKRRSALRELHARFRDGSVEKIYMTLVVGDWQIGEHVVDAPLLVKHRQNGERHVVVSAGGKAAKTRFRLLRSLGSYSLLQVAPLTGRTHQIRVHASNQGHPIAGDERYGDAQSNRAAKALGLPRLFLHAQSIAFPDAHGNELLFSTPLAGDLDQFLRSIPRSRSTSRPRPIPQSRR